MTSGEPRRGYTPPGTEQSTHTQATETNRLESAKGYLEQLPVQLRELWENPRELIDIPPNAFFRAQDDRKREQLIREFEEEMIKIARREIRAPEGAEANTEFSEGVLDALKSNIKEKLELFREYAMERVEERHELRYTDKLTGQLSKEGLEQRFYTEIKRLQTLEEGRAMVLIEFDIDSFKDVNEMLGHAGADKKIIELAKVIRSVLGELDSVGRRSGDEFSVILNNVDPDKLSSILQRIAAAANTIEYTKEKDNGELERTGKFMSITGSARVIRKDEDVSYELANKQADEGAIFQKINKKGTIVEWSPDLAPDLSTDEKRWEWAEKLARSKINRDADALYTEWRQYPEGSRERAITAHQIELMTGKNPDRNSQTANAESSESTPSDSILEFHTQIYIAGIEKKYGPLDGDPL